MTAQPNSLRAAVARQVKQIAAGWGPEPGMREMNDLLRLMAKWRAGALAQTFVAQQGLTVAQGPFAGMTYVAQSTEGALISRLLGVYESELHPHIEAFAGEGIECVIDVGCAEGYYAVGLARRMPTAHIHAYDISEVARAACAKLARQNGVADRVTIGGAFQPEDFQAFAGRRTLVLVDAEGAELDILQPDRGPALAGMNIIVETHDVFRPGALAAMMARFGPTHDIVRVDQQAKVFEQPAWLSRLGHLDQLLATWEWRMAPTPWLVMRPRQA